MNTFTAADDSWMFISNGEYRREMLKQRVDKYIQWQIYYDEYIALGYDDETAKRNADFSLTLMNSARRD